MRKELLLFSWLARALVVVAVVVLAGLPGPVEAGQRYRTAVASAIGGDDALAAAAHADLLDCVASPGQHQFHCHQVTPAAQAAATTRASGEEEPVLASGYADAIPRALHSRVAVAATVISSWRVPRFLFGRFRS